MNEENTQDGLSLKDIFSMFKAHWIAILVLMIVGALGGGIVGFASPAKYQASMKVGIIDKSDTSENTNTLTALRLTYSFKDYITHDYVAQRALEYLIKVDEEKYKDLRYSQIVSGLSAEIISENSLYINVYYVSTDAEMAKCVVENVILAAQAVANESRDENGKSIGLFADRIDTVTPATSLGNGNIASCTKTSKGTKTYVALGFAVGLVAGVAYAIIRELMNNTIRDKSYIESKYKIKVIGSIPEFVEENNNEK